THPHGESHRQALDGMSGALVVEGIDRYVPELRAVPEGVLVVRGRDMEHAPDAAAPRRQVGIPDAPCGSATEPKPSDRVMTVNGVVRPEIPIAPGERQFWRIVNAGSDTYVDMQIDGQPLDIVALDGFPLGYYGASHLAQRPDHWLVPPAGGLEIVVTGRPNGADAALRTRCVDTGPAGDPNPEMVLADLVSGGSSPSTVGTASSVQRPRSGVRPTTVRHPLVDRLKATEPHFVATFTEDKQGFYINGQMFALDAKPMLHVDVGTYQHWRIVNDTDEI